jgi:hypothetical protein
MSDEIKLADAFHTAKHALAKMIEKAACGSAALDARIAKLLMVNGRKFSARPSWHDTESIPPFTTVMDAADMLRPCGRKFGVGPANRQSGGWYAWSGEHEGGRDHGRGIGATPALAMCAAFVRDTDWCTADWWDRDAQDEARDVAAHLRLIELWHADMASAA